MSKIFEDLTGRLTIPECCLLGIHRGEVLAPSSMQTFFAQTFLSAISAMS